MLKISSPLGIHAVKKFTTYRYTLETCSHGADHHAIFSHAYSLYGSQGMKKLG